jgi:hypothetical protein
MNPWRNYPVLNYNKTWEENYKILSPKPEKIVDKSKGPYLFITIAVCVYFLSGPISAFFAALGR